MLLAPLQKLASTAIVLTACAHSNVSRNTPSAPQGYCEPSPRTTSLEPCTHFGIQVRSTRGCSASELLPEVEHWGMVLHMMSDGMIAHGELTTETAQKPITIYATFDSSGNVLDVKGSDPETPAIVQQRLPLLKSFALVHALGRECGAEMEWHSTCPRYN